MFRSFDASEPPASKPSGFSACLGYIGGNTPHVWTPEEWRRFASLKQAGIWVYSPTQNPLGAGQAASFAYRALGFTPNAPVRRFIVIDMETHVNDAWVEQFAKGNAGFDTVKYNSLSAAFPRGFVLPRGVIGEWVALWDGVSDLPPNTVAHQFAADVSTPQGLVDVSVWESDFAGRFGWGPRKG